MDCDPRLPVIVGTAQLVQRTDDPADSAEPLQLMTEVARRAAEDARAPALLGRLDAIYVPRGLWQYANPAAILRERFGVPQAETGLASVSGTMVQRMLNDAAAQIVAGKRDVVLLAGAEAERSKRRARKQGVELGWTEQAGPAPDREFDSPHPETTRHEIEIGLRLPALFFSLYENAMRHARGESLKAHRTRIAELWAGFARVAAKNPHAWTREPPSIETIRDTTADNRMVAWPYTKRLCANMVVDQAAALILCSAETAERMGVPRRQWVFLHAATEALQSPFLSNRIDFTHHPGMRLAAERLYALDEKGPEDFEHVDLYSCFPAAVQLGAEALGLSQERPLTVTGGLAYAGGPFNSYVLHSTAAMHERLRESPGSLGLASGIGGWFTKNAFSIYGSEPPARGFRHEILDAELAELPTREHAEQHDGRAWVETYGLAHHEGKPIHAILACLRDDGRRVWVRTEDQGFLEAMTCRETIGRAVEVRGNTLVT